jgi:cell division transport system ATP-binding protein
MIRIENVTKQYRGASRPALDNVTLEIEKGDFVFLVGASGSGKSSLMRLILREDVPNSGSVCVLGENLLRIPSRRVPLFRRKLGMVFQDFRLLPNKTVSQNVAFSLEVIGQSQGLISAAVPDVLDMVGLGHKANNLPHELSGGEQQRVALARAIVNKPAILLADEPTGNLDPSTSEDIMKLLERINASGTTVVMATHDRNIVDRLQKRVVVLSQGNIISDRRDSGYESQAPKPNKRKGDTGAINLVTDEQNSSAVATPATEFTPEEPVEITPIDENAPERLKTDTKPVKIVAVAARTESEESLGASEDESQNQNSSNDGNTK